MGRARWRSVRFAMLATLAMLALAAAPALLLVELLMFRRYGASPVPGPYELDGTAPGGSPGEPGDDRLGWVWLGDSLSAGVGADGPEDSFPWQTAADVAVRAGRDVELTCLAIPGARSADVLAQQVPAAVAVLGPGMTAIVAVGSNDVLRLVRPSSFRSSYASIVTSLTATGATVIAVGIPDLGSMMAVMAEPLRALVGLGGRRFDRAIRDVASAVGARYVAIDDRLSHGGRGRGQSALSDDAWHPNGHGYGIWARRVAAALTG